MGKGKSLSFVLPMYNESGNIEKVVTLLSGLASSMSDDFEIIVVDDASTDASASIVADIAARDKRVRLFRLGKNTKFGGAFAEGFKRAQKDVIVYMDSDMPVGPEDIVSAVSMIDSADIVTAVSSVEKGDTAFRKFVSEGYNYLVRTLFGLRVRDINSGCKIVRRDLVKDISFISRSPFVDTELFLHALKKKARIKEYSLIFRTRSAGKSYMARPNIIMATFRDMMKVWFKHRFSR
ncbi:MAG TPA: glycosyltransferase family 2 protein [Candidatus Omnitrophota bacterium]|nr:glycosyltransferase family 2 protein [Candidatus Omnitrophota bacterium]